jgi:CubicO group peptidase (beta-lactamase class C family)
MNFMTMIMNKGMFNGKRILSEASVAEMQKAQFPGLPVKSTLNICTDMPYGLGNWLQETDAAGNATILGAPGLNGTWPWIDLKKGYAVVVFPEKDVPDMKRTIYDAIRSEIDAAIK